MIQSGGAQCGPDVYLEFPLSNSLLKAMLIIVIQHWIQQRATKVFLKIVENHCWKQWNQ